jgi:hypothetical protein
MENKCVYIIYVTSIVNPDFIRTVAVYDVTYEDILKITKEYNDKNTVRDLKYYHEAWLVKKKIGD